MMGLEDRARALAGGGGYERQAITNADARPRADALLRCADCGRPLALRHGDTLIIRVKGREWRVGLPARITCDCGAVCRVA